MFFCKFNCILMHTIRPFFDYYLTFDSKIYYKYTVTCIEHYCITVHRIAGFILFDENKVPILKIYLRGIGYE